MTIKVFNHIDQIVTLSQALKKDGRRLNADDLSIISDGAIAYNESQILWVGPSKELPADYQQQAINGKGFILSPEFVDAHTHLIFAGDRAKEYRMRLDGASYEQIARAGGGILATADATRNASAEELFETAKKRIQLIANKGVKTIEIKSGYALTREGEEKCTRVIDRLKKFFAPEIQIINTYMAAHAIPKDYSANQYMNEVVLPLFTQLAGEKIIDCVDIFHEQDHFDSSHVRTLFTKANELKVPTKSHADEFNDNGGAELAVEFKALSCDHLMNTSDRGISALANSNTVATLLPGTSLYLGKSFANGRKLLDQGVKVAIASDFNPGSCHFPDLLTIACLAAKFYQMNSCELWSAITLNAAHALGLKDQGAIVTGLRPRLQFFKAKSFDHLLYHWGENFASNSP